MQSNVEVSSSAQAAHRMPRAHNYRNKSVRVRRCLDLHGDLERLNTS